MEHRIEATGETVEKALEKALAKLGANRGEVDVTILENGGSKFLGLFGGGKARVQVERLVHQHKDLGDLTRDLLTVMQIEADISMRQEGDTTIVRIDTDGLDGLLIGRRGQTLAALQHVVSRLASKEFGQDGHFVVDIGDYRQRREAHLIEKAQVLAEKVRTTGREINLEPLHAPDRRVVHVTVSEIEGVRSYTVGQGLHRNVVIAPEH